MCSNFIQLFCSKLQIIWRAWQSFFSHSYSKVEKRSSQNITYEQQWPEFHSSCVLPVSHPGFLVLHAQLTGSFIFMCVSVWSPTLFLLNLYLICLRIESKREKIWSSFLKELFRNWSFLPETDVSVLPYSSGNNIIKNIQHLNEATNILNLNQILNKVITFFL